MTDSILSVGAGTNQVPLIETINRMGYKSIACDMNPEAPGKALADIFINQGTYDSAPILASLSSLGIRPAAVLTRSTGQPVVTTAEIASKLDLPGISPETGRVLSHKKRLITTLQQKGIPSPRRFSKDDNYPLPVFVKPANTITSHAGMGKCTTRAEVEAIYLKARNASDDGSVNIEEYLTGYDIVSIDFVFSGEVIHLCTIGEISTGAPHFDGLGWYSVQDSWDEIAGRCFALMKQALTLEHGFFQTAMKFDPRTQEARIYEVHVEIGGDCVNDVYIPFHLNEYDVFRNNVLLALGKQPQPAPATGRPCMLLFRDKLRQYDITIPPQPGIALHHSTDCLLFESSSVDELHVIMSALAGDHFSIIEDEP